MVGRPAGTAMMYRVTTYLCTYIPVEWQSDWLFGVRQSKTIEVMIGV